MAVGEINSRERGTRSRSTAEETQFPNGRQAIAQSVELVGWQLVRGLHAHRLTHGRRDRHAQGYDDLMTRTAVVTGASSGIGEATASALAEAGFEVILGARRLDRLGAVAERLGGRALPLDVTDQASVDAFAAQLSSVDVLINNAGGAFGLSSVADASVDEWRQNIEVNVFGTLRITKALLPLLRASDDAMIVTVTSIAADTVYTGGSAYTAAKHAQSALHRTLRLELKGEPIRISEVKPGAVNTEFSLVRFGGDQAKADAVYEGITPLTAQDVAEVIGFIATRPAHVNIDSITVKPRSQYEGAQQFRAPRREGLG
jgi:NADP-dependent 3-hydroxy acid dehydrogenase YdfG